jgi:hypothetical protein
MRRIWIRVVVMALLLMPFAQAEAGSIRFGKDEQIRFVQDVTLKSTKGEVLYLGRMIRTQNFIAGYSLEDAGFVLGVKGASSKYYSMPMGDELARFQRGGFLPNPLPAYKPGFLDYVIGYSLWWVLAFAIGWFVFGRRRRSSTAVRAAPAQ